MSSILLVEDNAELGISVCNALEREGYTTRRATDGLQAIQLFRQQGPDMVILDWMLPRISGLDVLREIRVASSVPVLMLTARSDEMDRVLGLELGADDYVCKPFGMRELIARVRALFRRVDHLESILSSDRKTASEILEYGGWLRMDPACREVLAEGALVKVTRTEFDLLSLFAANPGRAFSREYLLDVVWGGASVSGDRSVDNTISRLRHKLGDKGKDIEAVWGVGYRLRRE